MRLSVAKNIPVLEEYDVEKDDLETMLDIMPMYGFIDNKGQLDDSIESPYTDDGMLDEEETADHVGRDGESELSFAYDDFQYHFEGMIDGESFSNISEDELLDLPKENSREAAGALFGASYALLRDQVMEEGYPAEHASFEQNIDSKEARERFFEEGALEIKGEVMGPWGYSHEKMNEIMDADIALKAYNDVAGEII
jgi:hypothetical protein